MARLQRAILLFERSGLANCCWHEYCTQNGGPHTIPGHPKNSDWTQRFWTALNIEVLNQGTALWLVAIGNKLLDLGPMDDRRRIPGLRTWRESDALNLLPKGIQVLEFARDDDYARFADGLPEECTRFEKSDPRKRTRRVEGVRIQNPILLRSYTRQER